MVILLIVPLPLLTGSHISKMAQYNHPSARSATRYEPQLQAPKQLPITYPRGGSGGAPHQAHGADQAGGQQVWVPPNPYLYTGKGCPLHQATAPGPCLSTWPESCHLQQI